MKKLKYYSFDWDDNLLEMPSLIYVIENGKEVGLSTSEFAKKRATEKIQYSDEPFREFRMKNDDKFMRDSIESLLSGKTRESWNDFVECINNGSIFSIITARGHSPEIMRETVKTMIRLEMGGINYNQVINSLIDFIKTSKDVIYKDLINYYIDDLCKFYPVSHPSINGDSGNCELAKTRCFDNFIDHIKNMINKLDYDMENIVIGFSDDDDKNVNLMKKHVESKYNNVKIYKTADKKVLVN